MGKDSYLLYCVRGHTCPSREGSPAANQCYSSDTSPNDDNGTLLRPASPYGMIRVCILIGVRTLLLFPIPVLGGGEPLNALYESG